MSVPRDRVKEGAVFEFSGGNRRVMHLQPSIGNEFDVHWVYDDGQMRDGRLAGITWGPHFALLAISEVVTKRGTVRRLLSGRQVEDIASTATVTLTTRCPRKWLAVDLESGEIWEPASSNGGSGFGRASEEAIQDLEAVLAQKRELGWRDRSTG